MDLTSKPWTCCDCGTVYISPEPDNSRCADCTRTEPCGCAFPQAPVSACPDVLGVCQECGGPVCPHCGQRLLQLIPVTATGGQPAWQVITDG
jgi:hypothetical protein